MTYPNPHRLKFFAIALLASTAFAATASAVNLPEISPEQISQDSHRTYNETLGRSEVIAPSFDPFESTDGLAGTASLRSAGSAITIDGRNVAGGAFLDLSMIYTSASSDPYDIRGIDSGVYLSGQPVDVIRRDNRTLDCSENVREVVYDDGYYNGAYSGYIGGVFRTYPRYRGHRGYGHSYRHGRSIFSGYPYKYKKSKYKKYKKYRKYDDDHEYRRKDRRADRDDDRRRYKYKDRHKDGDRYGDSDRDRRRNDKRSREHRPDRDLERRADRDRRHDRNNDRSREHRPDHRTYDRKVRTDRRTPEMQIPPPAPRRERVVKTRQPVVASPPPPPPPKVRQRKVDRAVDRHFNKPRKPRVSHKQKGNRVLNFFPMQFSTYSPRRDVYVTTRCAREETLTMHIPQERLDAARFDGMTVLLLDREGREIPVFIPPNYVEGFRQAASNVSYPVRSLPTGPIYSEPDYSAPLRSDEIPPPAPSYRDPSQPIIYGDPASVTPAPQPTYQGYPQQ